MPKLVNRLIVVIVARFGSCCCEGAYGLHGGVATVESQRKVGSTFCVRIPYVPLPDEEEDFDEDSAS